MNKAGARKAFTAELQRLKAMGMDVPTAGVAMVPAPAASVHGLGDEVRGLRGDLKALTEMFRAQYGAPEDAAPAPGAAPSPGTDPREAELQRQKEEVDLLKMELRALAHSIQDTKREIASLRTREEETDRLLAVASELDAVVGATEGATDGILDAAEKIDTIAHNLKAHGDDKYVNQLADDLTDHVMAIFENCNFQDITGQRITKVVNTLKFVEERIDRMIDIWGSDAFEGLRDTAESDDEDSRLLNGPQLRKQVSQDEIDKLFD
ncbi:MAG: protein phosphatase CheZ [Rhodospirillaceae bacterium]